MANKLFKEKWLEAVNKKNSVLCAGLDPAEYDMGRGEHGLPKGANKRDRALQYIGSVSPYCAAVKPNMQYWKNDKDLSDLEYLTGFAHSLGMVVIDDSKLADIGSTNDAGMFYSAKRGFDAVTYSPFAGNMKEAAEQAHKRGLGIIGMCLMSNPEYEIEKNKLVLLDDNIGIDEEDIIEVNGRGHIKQYIDLAMKSEKYGVDGIVIGAPKKLNPEGNHPWWHPTEKEIEKARKYAGNEMLVLLPGVGAQGGEADILWKYFNKDNVIVNVGRDLMLPNGSNTSDEEQAAVAEYYKDMLNKLRK